MAYGEDKYATLLYSTGSSEGGGNNPGEVDLMDYLPLYYHGVLEMEELQDTIGKELSALKHGQIDIINQSFVETATWNLSRWEFELGLQTDPNKPYESRREMVIAKLRGVGTTTPEMIRRTAAAFSGGDVIAEDVPGEYRFVIRFVGTLGIPANMSGLIQIIEEIKPAHLAYTFVYTYTNWSTLRSTTWNQAKTKTWNELRTYE